MDKITNVRVEAFVTNEKHIHAIETREGKTYDINNEQKTNLYIDFGSQYSPNPLCSIRIDILIAQDLYKQLSQVFDAIAKAQQS